MSERLERAQSVELQSTTASSSTRTRVESSICELDITDGDWGSDTRQSLAEISYDDPTNRLSCRTKESLKCVSRMSALTIESFHTARTELAPEDKDLEGAAASETPQTLFFPDGGWQAWSQVLMGALLVFNSWGLVNSYGVFQATYTSINLSSPAGISWIGSLQPFCLLFVGVFTGPVFDAGRARILVLIGSILMVLGLLTTSFSGGNQDHANGSPKLVYWQVMLSQGICTGLGMGLTFLPSVGVLATYFQKHRTFATGVALTGASIGGIVYPIILRSLLPKIGFRWSVRVIALIAFVTLAIANLLVRQRKGFHKRRPKLIAADAVKETPFVLLLIGMVLSFMGVYIPYFYIETRAIEAQVDFGGLPSYWLVSFLGIGGIPGRLIPNLLADKIGPLNVHTVCVIAGGIMIFGFPFTNTIASLIAWAVMYGFFSGAFISLPPASTMAMTKDLTQMGGRLGLVFTANSIALLLGSPIAGDILQGFGYIEVSIFAALLVTAGGFAIGAARVAKGGKKLWVKV